MKKVFSITKKVKFIREKESIITVFDLNHEIFVVYIIALNIRFGEKIDLL